MPRSSKHKSSKHSSRDAREHSDSERDSGAKDRRSKEESGSAKASKDSGSGEKRRLDSKEAHGNGEYSDEYASSSKRRKDGGGGDRWNGGEEGTKKSKAAGDSKSRRRDGSVGVYGEGEEVKRSSGKGDGKHRDSASGRSREGATEKERIVKEGGRSEESVDEQEQRVSKQVFDINDSKKMDELRSPEPDNQLERRMRKKRDDYSDGDKHLDNVGDGYDRHLSSKDEAKDVKKKDDRRKEEKYRDKYKEEIDRENKHRHDKQRDERPAKDHTTIRSDDKHTRDEKNSLESRQKRTKLPESDRDHNRDRDGDCDLDSIRDPEHHSERDRDYDIDRDHDYDKDRDWDWDRDRDQERERDRDRDRRRDRRRDRDGSHVDDRSARGKDSGTKKRTLDDRDDYTDSKSRAVKSYYPDAEKRSLSTSRADSDVDRGRSQHRQAHADSTGTSNKHRSSPASNTHIGKDDYRNAKAEDSKYRDPTVEQRTKGSREGYSGTSDRGPKYKLMEKPIKIDESHAGDLSTERSSSTKASPGGLMDRSPSSSSIDRRYVNRSGVRRNLEIDENGRRNGTDVRDFSTSDDRLGRESTLEKPLLDEPSQADSSLYGRTSQSNASLIPPPPGFRATLDRPYMGSLDDDVRDSSNSRYRRSSEPGFGRGHVGNSWRAVPNWNSPLPNGFVPFPPGPAHGGFQTMVPQFTSQPLFGVRPPMEVNHAGIPYHIADADRFPGHLRPLGWPNLMDGTGTAHLHGWDSSNGVFRDDPHLYGNSDWDRNRHSANSHGWESGSETWKEQNCDSKKELPSPVRKDESVPALADNGLTDLTSQMSQDEHNRDELAEKSPERKLFSLSSPAEVQQHSLSLTLPDKEADTLTPRDDTSLFSRFYLSKLDISVDLVSPELYDQCMCALNVDKSASVDAIASTELLLKNGSRTRQKYAATLSRRSPFPEIDNSIFQIAMDLYKKHMVKLPNKGDANNIVASNMMQADQSIPITSSENGHASVSASNGIKDVPIPTLESVKVETMSPAKEQLEEINETCSQMEQDHDKSGMSSPSSDNVDQAAAVAGLQEKEPEITTDMVHSGDAEEDYSLAAKNEAQLDSTLHGEGDNVDGKAKTTGFADCADEKLGFGDTKVNPNPLIVEDGSPKACDALMPGSNESESLILSRIHHSPESTH
ncbi:uncharacterized protein LOC106775822 isoform X1 [Vigna radiata var. radiata]|uniref:Uncharacterized protein LOC106775822 isoform X1 n=2 Tax=Vigna radiata var. radiata TaxID=3916 RepID=A0A1S3VJQ4_VIGRR|nr:uncharacterized protein LOC106775822 isoform X1 [Vigna radiata var. radiata]